HFGVPIESKVTLTIYDMHGRTVKTLVQMQLQAGSYTTTWKAVNLSSGVYYCRMEAIGVGTNRCFTETKKLILLK
ncbi:MAG: T9SS type A sorting domain-containing protein, partial [Ignavibacteriales bacterium]|nr:T9SS type A sorting domain-containing protein [Ignavibacteriales bacterium]